MGGDVSGKALDQLREKYPHSPTETEKKYQAFRKSLVELDARVAELETRRADLAATCETVFTEWQQETEAIRNVAFKEESKASLISTREALSKITNDLDSSFEKARDAVAVLKGYVTVLKHRLNAESIGKLDEPAKIDHEIKQAQAELAKSIKSVDEFLKKRSG